jgi:hypothetical protein
MKMKRAGDFRHRPLGEDRGLSTFVKRTYLGGGIITFKHNVDFIANQDSLLY